MLNEYSKIEKRLKKLRKNKIWSRLWQWQYQDTIKLFFEKPVQFYMVEQNEFRKTLKVLKEMTKEVVKIEDYAFIILNFNLEKVLKPELLFDLSFTSVYVINKDSLYTRVFTFTEYLDESLGNIRVIEYTKKGDRYYRDIAEKNIPSNDRLVEIIKGIITNNSYKKIPRGKGNF